MIIVTTSHYCWYNQVWLEPAFICYFTESILQFCHSSLGLFYSCHSFGLLCLFYSCVTVYSVYFTLVSQFTQSILQLCHSLLGLFYSCVTVSQSILQLCHSLLGQFYSCHSLGLLCLFYSCVTVYSVYFTVVSQFTQYSHKSPVVIEVSHRTNADSIDTGEDGK